MYALIQGRNLLIDTVIDNFLVTIGASFCNILQINDNQMVVIPPMLQPTSSNDTTCDTRQQLLDIVVSLDIFLHLYDLKPYHHLTIWPLEYLPFEIDLIF